MGEGLDFFISYTQADRAWAEWIAWILEEAGYKTRVQAWDFPAGSNFVVEMQRAAAGSERTLAVLSSDYLDSLFGMAEWAAAFAQDPTGEKGKLLPVRVRKVKPVGLLSPIVYIDLVDLNEAASRERLLKGLSRGRAKPVSAPPFPGGVRPSFPGGPTVPLDPEAAQSELANLPLDVIPAPSQLPAGSCMPLSVNPLFVGRDDDLRALARQLKAGEISAIGQVEIAAATGMGGIGKTQLAAEFVHRYGKYFAGGVFWLSFADPAGVPSEVAASGRGLSLSPSFDDLPLDQQVHLVKEAWKRPIPRLLVFDNCEEPELLARWRPPHGGARVLVTSQRYHWDRSLGVNTVVLGTLKRVDSVKLLHGFRPDLAADDPLLNEIADDLGDLPLALHLAGSFLAQYQHSSFGQPAAYLEQLRKGDLLNHPSLQGKGSDFLPTEHERHVAKTFALSYEKLNPEDSVDALAQSLLARAAYFAPSEPIPRKLLLATVGVSGEDDSFEAEDALARLIAVGLLELGEGGFLRMHRLVVFFTQAVKKDDEARTAVEDTLLQEAGCLIEAGYPAPLLSWQAHLRSVTDAAKVREDIRAADLCSQHASQLYLVGNYSRAREYDERASAIRQRISGSDHPDTARSLVNLGIVLSAQGNYSRACECFERALEILDKLMGPEHPYTVQALGNLGVVLDNQGDYSQAREIFERTLTIREKISGPQHRDVATDLDNLGVVLGKQGDYSGARGYHERALAIREKELGPGHPDTARSLNNLGGALEGLGDLGGALDCYARALEIREKTLGAEHPDTARSLHNVGVIIYKQGNPSRAGSYFEQALTIFEQQLGPDHPHTKLLKSRLALSRKPSKKKKGHSNPRP